MWSHRRSTAWKLAAARAKTAPDNRLVEFLEQHLAEINAAIRALTPETDPEIPDDIMVSPGSTPEVAAAVVGTAPSRKLSQEPEPRE
jgi:hypothetical protein